MAAPAGEVQNTPTVAPTSPVDSLKQQVNAISLQINLLKSQIETTGKDGKVKTTRKLPTFEQLNQASKQPVTIAHSDRKIEYKKSGQSVASQGLIKRLELIEIELTPEERVYLGIPLNVSVYINNDETGWRYFRGIELIFVPDFSKPKEYAPAEHHYLDIDEKGQIKRELRYPGFSQNIKEYLTRQTFGTQVIHTDLSKDTGTKKEKNQITFQNKRYYVESYGHKVPIGLGILSQGRIVPGVSAESLGANLQLLNFQNFITAVYFDSGKVQQTQSNQIRLINHRGVYLVDANGKVTFQLLPLSSSPFFEGTNRTPNLRQYVKYLNTIFFEK